MKNIHENNNSKELLKDLEQSLKELKAIHHARQQMLDKLAKDKDFDKKNQQMTSK